jgi:hypothetical protein
MIISGLTELIISEINITGTKKICVASYYRPPSDDGTSLDQLNISLSRLDKTNSSNIWVGGDFNLGNIDWSIPSFITGKPDAKQHHQQLLDIIADHNLHQVTDKPTQNERTLDLLLMNNPSNLNKLCTLPPIGLADHDIVYAEIDTWLKRVRETPRKVMKYKEANWDKIKKDLENILTTINNIYEKSDTNILWNTLKNDIINSIESNIPQKLFTYKQRLPWINNNLHKLINKKNKYHRKKNQNPSMYKKLKHTVQKDVFHYFSWCFSDVMVC